MHLCLLGTKKEIQMSLLSAKEQCVCAVTHNKSSKTNSSTEARYKALSDRGLTLWLLSDSLICLRC